MDLKREFVHAASAPGANIAELCRGHGISRKSGYKWLRRFKASGLEGLRDRSRRPRTIAGTDGEIVVRIKELRDQFSNWAPRRFRCSSVARAWTRPA